MQIIRNLTAYFLRVLLHILPLRISRAIYYRIPQTVLAFDIVTKYKGVLLRVFTGETVGRKIYFMDDFEPDQLDVFEQLISPGDVFFDIGANIGIYSLVAARAGAKAYAFEPAPEVLAYLNDNIELNHADVVVVPEATGERKGNITFYRSAKDNMGVGRIMEYGKRTDHSLPPIDVPMDTLDHYSERYGTPSIIKMDIEGAELFALRGAQDLLSRPNAPLLMIEFHPSEIASLGGKVSELITTIRTCGYRQYVSPSAKGERWYVFTKSKPNLPGFQKLTAVEN